LISGLLTHGPPRKTSHEGWASAWNMHVNFASEGHPTASWGHSLGRCTSRLRRPFFAKPLRATRRGTKARQSPDVNYLWSEQNWPVAEVPSAARCFHHRPGSSHIQRRQITQTERLEDRLANEAAKLRKQAQGTPHGIERERLMRRARQAETGSHMSAWLSSPGLQPPR